LITFLRKDHPYLFTYILGTPIYVGIKICFWIRKYRDYLKHLQATRKGLHNIWMVPYLNLYRTLTLLTVY
jgi:hypothetical protein